jgi:hypothetical protein
LALQGRAWKNAIGMSGIWAFRKELVGRAVKTSNRNKSRLLDANEQRKNVEKEDLCKWTTKALLKVLTSKKLDYDSGKYGFGTWI